MDIFRDKDANQPSMLPHTDQEYNIILSLTSYGI